jgi:CheY-like chemotaxis protein
MRALVPEENPINQFLVALMLKEAGIVTTLASNGQQALQLLNKQPQYFDVVLMDIQMPIVDGLTGTREIRKNSNLASLSVIALTAGVLEEVREAALAASVDDFMTKLISQNQLVALLLR